MDASTVSGGSLEGVLARIVATVRERVANGFRELEGLAIGTSERVGKGVEGQVSSESHGSDEIGGSDESVGSGVSIVTAGEVTVVGGDDCTESS